MADTQLWRGSGGREIAQQKTCLSQKGCMCVYLLPVVVVVVAMQQVSVGSDK